MALLWPELDYLAALYFALACCFAVIVVVKVFFGVTSNTIGKLPWIGGWIDTEGRKIQQRVSNLFGGYADKIEGRIGASWHSMARIVDRLGHAIHAHAALLGAIASYLPGVQPIVGLWALVHRLEGLVHDLTRGRVGVGHDVTPRVKVIERGIGNDVLPRIRTLEREVNGEITRERVRARTAERAATREITNLWRWTRAHTLEAGTLAFAGAVAIALGRLGLKWLRCPSLGRLGRGIGCGGFGALEELLFGVVTVVAATDLCEASDVAGGIAHTIRPVLMELVDVENALIGCHGATLPLVLDLAPLRLPPVRDALPLAA